MSPLPPPIGHETLLAHLTGAMAEDRLHHALLFEGPAGVGKHTVATYLAMMANCEAPDGRPCGVCPTCVRIQAGNHPDVITLAPDPEKATKVIPVDAVRELIRATGYHRYGGRRRFVIIDPAEALAAAASNALLKTLEEPPADTHFVLIATRARALLPTIRSRCQIVRFSPIPVDRLAAWLSARSLPDARALAVASHGAPGIALGLAAGTQTERTLIRDRMLDALGGDLARIYDLTEALTKGERADWSARVESALELLEELLRDAVVTASASDVPLLHTDKAAVSRAWANALWPGGIERLRRAILETRGDLAVNVSAKTTLDALFTRTATELGSARSAGVLPR